MSWRFSNQIRTVATSALNDFPDRMMIGTFTQSECVSLTRAAK
jgi:hypothetical protein